MTNEDLQSWREWRHLRAEKFAADRVRPAAPAAPEPEAPVRLTRADKAEALVARFAEWILIRSKDGHSKGYAIPSSTPGKYYTVTLDGCDCPDAARQTQLCKHRRALNLALDRRGLTADFIPTPRPEDRAWLAQFLAASPRFPRTTRED